MARKKKDEPKTGLPGWMATYGDMVTLLLCFFILLFSMSTVDIIKYQAVVESFEDRFGVFQGETSSKGGNNSSNNGDGILDIPNQPDTGIPKDDNSNAPSKDGDNDSDSEQEAKAAEMAEEFEEYFVEEGIDSLVLVTYTSSFVKLTIAGDLLFDSGDATIKHGETILQAISNAMYKFGFRGYALNIKGHTDNIPMKSDRYPSNWYLSSARAIAVGERLISQYNFNPSKLLCTGYGEHQPLASNDTVGGRAKNRRVEFEVMLNQNN